MTWSIYVGGHDGESEEERTAAETAIADLAEEKIGQFIRDLKADGYHPTSATFTGNYVHRGLMPAEAPTE